MTVKYIFEWDEEKNETNADKHGIWFEEARTIWTDPHGQEAFDPEHNDGVGAIFATRRLLFA